MVERLRRPQCGTGGAGPRCRRAGNSGEGREMAVCPGEALRRPYGGLRRFPNPCRRGQSFLKGGGPSERLAGGMGPPHVRISRGRRGARGPVATTAYLSRPPRGTCGMMELHRDATESVSGSARPSALRRRCRCRCDTAPALRPPARRAHRSLVPPVPPPNSREAFRVRAHPLVARWPGVCIRRLRALSCGGKHVVKRPEVHHGR